MAELSTVSALYQYSPLPQDHSFSFRLVTLYPAYNISAPLLGDIHISSVSRTDPEALVWEEYETLSYAWGDNTSTAIIEFPDKSYLPIGGNLESFLRHRRQREQCVVLWVDAICINQQDDVEKSLQVQAMGLIYSLSARLSIWLGAPSADSTLAMNALLEISHDNPFSKLRVPLEESAAIESLLRRPWWSRAWVIQEVALGGLGPKHSQITLRCGSECIKWVQLILACSRMHANALRMRQSYPTVENVLNLDTLPSRWSDEVLGTSESYACRLLKQLSEHRNCLASDPRDKIYALLGLWMDAMEALLVDTLRKQGQTDTSYRAVPTVDYRRCVEDVYVDFATWIIYETQSLDLLNYCQANLLNAPVAGTPPTWVPDWSQVVVQARLPCAKEIERGPIPWWTLPVHEGVEDGRRIIYPRESQASYRKRAEEVLLPAKPTLHFVPEWFVDKLDPDGKQGLEALLKELQSERKLLFLSHDQSDRALGDEEEDIWATLGRTQAHNEKDLQKQVLSHYSQSSSLLRTQYRACADTICKVRVTGKSLQVEGMLVDTIREVFDPFPEEIKSDWTNSTLLMVRIGKCKQAVIHKSMERCPYLDEHSRLVAFWRTLFAGQQARDETNIASWLPLVPQDWRWEAPSPTILESGRLECAELQKFILAFSEHFASKISADNTIKLDSFDQDLAKDDILLEAGWSSSDRLQYARTFEVLGKEWVDQPYDLYHRPFHLPHVVPDPFWESRCLHDDVAKQASIHLRHQTLLESWNGETRELRRDARRFIGEQIRQQPARVPPYTDDTELVKYALGRRFFVSEEGYFGIAPPNAREGDQVALFHGGETPFILREMDTTFQVVGQSYVHGFMEGEAFSTRQVGSEVRNIILT